MHAPHFVVLSFCMALVAWNDFNCCYKQGVHTGQNRVAQQGTF